MYRYAISSGMMPTAPNDMSMSCHHHGMPRIVPAISASGTTAAQAIMPNWTTQTLRTGSLSGPQNATAITRWANASQSVP